MAVYQASQVFVETPWKKYIEGDKQALNKQQKKGALLFYTSVNNGGAGCVDCHSGDFFTDEAFHVLAVPQIGFGKQLNGDDRGRYLRTGIIGDRYAFRTPGLLNVEHTAPYGHNGAFQTLNHIIRHHLNPGSSLDTYDFKLHHLTQKNIITTNAEKWSYVALDKLKKDQSQKQSKLVNLSLEEAEINALEDFLHSLTDPCLDSEKCLSPWVPKRTDSNPDGLILYAH